MAGIGDQIGSLPRQRGSEVCEPVDEDVADDVVEPVADRVLLADAVLVGLELREAVLVRVPVDDDEALPLAELVDVAMEDAVLLAEPVAVLVEGRGA